MLGSMTSEYFREILLEKLFSIFDVRDFSPKELELKIKSVEIITLTDTSLFYVSLGGGELAPY